MPYIRLVVADILFLLRHNLGVVVEEVQVLQHLSRDPNAAHFVFFQLSLLKNVFVQSDLVVKHEFCLTNVVLSHGGSKKVLFPDGTERKDRSKVIRSSCLDLLKSLVERVRTRGSSVAGREADRAETNQVRTKTTHGTNAQQASRYSIVRSCSGTPKGMGLGCESSFVKCAYKPI